MSRVEMAEIFKWQELLIKVRKVSTVALSTIRLSVWPKFDYLGLNAASILLIRL